MNDLELIEFLLNCELVENQLRVDSHIGVDVLASPLEMEFFTTMQQTGREFEVIGDHLRFEARELSQPKLKIAD